MDKKRNFILQSINLLVFLTIMLFTIGVKTENIKDYIDIKNYKKNFEYKIENKRDPFIPLPVPSMAANSKQKTESFSTEKINKDEIKTKVEAKSPDIIITGILWNENNPLMILKNDDRIFKEGMAIDNDNKIIIRKIEKQYVLIEKTESGRTVNEKVYMK